MNMDILTILIVILIIAWFLGGVALPSAGGLIHLILVIALIILVVKMLRGTV